MQKTKNGYKKVIINLSKNWNSNSFFLVKESKSNHSDIPLIKKIIMRKVKVGEPKNRQENTEIIRNKEESMTKAPTIHT